MTDIYPLQTQEVRDLAWACFSAPLIFTAQLQPSDINAHGKVVDCPLQLTPQRQLWLEQLDRDPRSLHEHLAQRPTHRLGMYFEQLWHFFLQQDPAVDLLAHNLPVHHEGRTLGEFDCLYFCHERQCTVHLELAVKFFLGAPDDTARTNGSAQQWLGPDARDRLDLKLEHILNRQIQLADNPVAKQQLHVLDIATPIKEIAFKGYLFAPQSQQMLTPPGYNQERSLQHWVTVDDCNAYTSQLKGSDQMQFVLLPKMLWLGPVQNISENVSQNKSEAIQRPKAEILQDLQTHFENSIYPVMVAAIDNYGRESQRFFVTDSGWPLSHSADD